MKVAVVGGEIIGIQETTSGRILKVLHGNGQGKDVLDIYFPKVNKKTGAPMSLPDLKVGQLYKGMVNFNGLCFPA